RLQRLEHAHLRPWDLSFSMMDGTATASTTADRSLYRGLVRKLGRNDELASARTRATDLQDSLLLDLDVVRNIGRLGVEASGRQDLQLGIVKTLSVAGCVHARQDGDFPRVRMGVRSNLEALREFVTHRVGPGRGRITDEVKLLQSRRRQGTLRCPFHLGWR